MADKTNEREHDRRGRKSRIILLGLGVCLALGLPPLHRFIVLIYLACPSAVASYVMAEAMGGDGRLAGSVVALTTIYSFLSLSTVLLLATF